MLIDRFRQFVRNLDWRLIGMILAIKGLIFAFAGQSYQIFSNQPIPTWRGWFELWNRWDSQHYLNIAQFGYTTVGERRFEIAFFPLYPWLVRLFTFGSGDYLASALFVSTLASIAAGLLLRRLVEMDFSSEIARAAVWFMFIFPTSYFLHIGYTESLFLALTLGCFLAARTNSWWLAGLLGAAASLTRIGGLLLFPALVIEIVQQYRTMRQFKREWLWIFAAPLGFVGYMGLNAYAEGNKFAFLTTQKEGWGKSLSFPWHGIHDTYLLFKGLSPAEAQMVGLQELIFILLSAVCIVVCWRKLRPSYTMWMACNWLLFTSTSYVVSVPRYSLVLFPIYIIFALLSLKSDFAKILLSTWSLLFLALFASIFVRGGWAF